MPKLQAIVVVFVRKKKKKLEGGEIYGRMRCDHSLARFCLGENFPDTFTKNLSGWM
jgi:hypothetical protein